MVSLLQEFRIIIAVLWSQEKFTFQKEKSLWHELNPISRVHKVSLALVVIPNWWVWEAFYFILWVFMTMKCLRHYLCHDSVPGLLCFLEKKSLHKYKAVRGAERRLGVDKGLMLFQRTRVWLPAPTWSNSGCLHLQLHEVWCHSLPAAPDMSTNPLRDTQGHKNKNTIKLRGADGLCLWIWYLSPAG